MKEILRGLMKKNKFEMCDPFHIWIIESVGKVMKDVTQVWRPQPPTLTSIAPNNFIQSTCKMPTHNPDPYSQATQPNAVVFYDTRRRKALEGPPSTEKAVGFSHFIFGAEKKEEEKKAPIILIWSQD